MTDAPISDRSRRSVTRFGTTGASRSRRSRCHDTKDGCGQGQPPAHPDDGEADRNEGEHQGYESPALVDDQPADLLVGAEAATTMTTAAAISHPISRAVEPAGCFPERGSGSTAYGEYMPGGPGRDTG